MNRDNKPNTRTDGDRKVKLEKERFFRNRCPECFMYVIFNSECDPDLAIIKHRFKEHQTPIPAWAPEYLEKEARYMQKLRKQRLKERERAMARNNNNLDDLIGDY